MYYPQPYRPEEEEEEEQEVLDLTLYDRIESQWIIFSETSLVFCTLSASTLGTLLLRAFDSTSVAFGILGIATIIIVIIAIINWSQMNQRRRNRLFLGLLATTTATAITTADTVIDLIKLNPVTFSHIINTSVIVGIIMIVFIIMAFARRTKNAR